MKEKIMFIFATFLSIAITASCNLPRLQITPTPSPTFSPTINNPITPKIVLSETPSETPSPIATNTFIVGDLGWGTIHGKVKDSTTGAPIVGATVICRHSSYTSTSLCNTSVFTTSDGIYTFPEFFFHDTDRVQLEVQAQGYVTQTLNVNFLVSPWLNADFAIVPAISTELPQVMCTQPACGPYQSLFCPQGNCPGGCGYICATPAAICTPPLCAIGTSEVYHCPGVCPGGCGTTCATFTPAP